MSETQPIAKAFGTPNYGLTKRIEGASFDDVLARTKVALADNGFGVLTEIDIQKTLDAKLGVAWPRYQILGACNPPLAHQALQGDPAIGLLLPCNVVVAQDGDAVVVSAIDPAAMFSVVENPDVQPIAAAVKEKLSAVLAAL